MTSSHWAITEFDVRAFYAAMDARRVELALSWPQVARALWEQSAALNRERQDHPISPATLTGIVKRGDCTCQHALFILRWLGQPPERFLSLPPPDLGPMALPAAGDGHRLRWDLAAVFESLDARRRERSLTWPALARQLRCTPNQISGLRTVRYAIRMTLMMRIVQWLERPAAAFVYAARW